MARDRPAPYDEGGLSAAAPVGSPLYCIETERSLLRGVMKHPHFQYDKPPFTEEP